MKKLIFITTFILSITLMAQPPQGFKYQAVVRDAAGEIVANQSVGFRLSIRQGSTSGTIVYRETQTATTNAFGLANLVVGNGTPVIGFFPDINWRDGKKYLQVETNLTGSYVTMGTAELMSVPFALYSASDWLKNGSDLYYNDGKIGIGTDVPEGSLHVPINTTLTEGVFGQDISVFHFTADVSIGDDTNTPVLYVGQSPSYKGFLLWQTNTDPMQAYFNVGTFNGSNALVLQGVGGNTGVGEWYYSPTLPAHKLDVLGDINFTGNLFRNGTQYTGGGFWSQGFDGIYYNGGQVGIGTESTVAELHVERNNDQTNSQLWIDQGGTGDATIGFSTGLIGDDWAIGVDQSDGEKLKIGQSYNASVNTRLTIEKTGNIGIGTESPVAKLHVLGNQYVEGDQDLYTYYPFITLNNTSISGNAGLCFETMDAYRGWLYFNDYTQNLVLNAESGAGFRTDMVIHSDGRVGINTASPASQLHVRYDDNTHNYLGYSNSWASYFYHYELEADGDGQTALYAYRTRTTPNAGTGYAYYNGNFAIKGHSFYADLYSFGTAGFNYNFSASRSGGILGAEEGGSYWGSLGYRSSSLINYGGYFTSYTSGTGKDSQANTGIGIGAWGDLFGADIHGKVYGTFTEGENYALYADGKMFRNDLDVHLQKTGNKNVVLYTNVSTNATIQTSGYATLVNGESTIAFDEAFANAVSKTEPVVVTVTPTGNSNGVYLSQVNSSGFTVIENNNGKSNVTVSYIAIGKRAGYENPVLPQEVIDPEYTSHLARGLHNDNDTETDGEGLYYESGELVVGKHQSVLPDPNKPQEDPYAVKPAIETKTVAEKDVAANGKPLKALTPVNIPEEPIGDPNFKNGVNLEQLIENNAGDKKEADVPTSIEQKPEKTTQTKNSAAMGPTEK